MTDITRILIRLAEMNPGDKLTISGLQFAMSPDLHEAINALLKLHVIKELERTGDASRYVKL